MDLLPAPPKFLLLSAPIGADRIPPDEIPNDLETFKRWSDQACVEWHPSLTRASYVAWEDRRFGDDDTSYRLFVAAYRSWWQSSEQEKMQRMGLEQIQSHNRLNRLELARAIVKPIMLTNYGSVT